MSNQPEQTEKKGLVARLDSTAFARGHAELWTFIKFAAVSTFGAGLELAAQNIALAVFKALNVQAPPDFILFKWLQSSVEMREGYTLGTVVYAFMASTAIGYTIGFFLNRSTTFHADSNIALGIFLNVLLIVFTIAANSLLGPVIFGYVARLNLSDGLTDNIAKVLSMMSTVLWVYPANRFVIHRKRKEVPADA